VRPPDNLFPPYMPHPSGDVADDIRAKMPGSPGRKDHLREEACNAGLVRAAPLASFYIFAYVYSWAIALPLVLQGQGVIPARLPLALHYLSAFGPALAALTITKLLRRRLVVDREVASPGVRRACEWTGGGRHEYTRHDVGGSAAVAL